jgi:AcrR family transcriptional regulator
MMATPDPDPGTRQTRNAERTRHAILTAAAEAMAHKGTALSIAEVAASAGVSKSGLLHHFGSRDQLLIAVVDDANERFRAAVMTHLDLSENHPGKVLRAYVRALCGGSEETAQFFASAPMWNGVLEIPGIADVIAADAEWWATQLSSDGMDADRIMVVRRAAEGIAAAAAFGEETPERVLAGRDILLGMCSADQD